MLLPRDTIVTNPETLSPLPTVLKQGLVAVTFFGFLSFSLCITLGIRLCVKLAKGRKQKLHHNQVLFLICNLIFSDILQSQAFLLNANWLGRDAILVGTSACWAQGFFVSVGDLASGVFTLGIAVHTFSDVVLSYRPTYKVFLCYIAAMWTFVFGCALVGILLHRDDFYVRAGAWCWINGKYATERLWLHYMWIFIAEFGTVLIYSLLFVIINRRLRTNYYSNSGTATRARTAANAIIPYPIIYVICTLPLAASRMQSMTGVSPSFLQLCISGAMITSNGWLDVLLYSLTRRALIFGAEMPKQDMRALETFGWKNEEGYGTTTIIASDAKRSGISRRRGGPNVYTNGGNSSTEELFDPTGIKTKTEVHVKTTPLELSSFPQTPRSGHGTFRDEDGTSSVGKKSFSKDRDCY